MWTFSPHPNDSLVFSMNFIFHGFFHLSLQLRPSSISFNLLALGLYSKFYHELRPKYFVFFIFNFFFIPEREHFVNGFKSRHSFVDYKRLYKAPQPIRLLELVRCQISQDIQYRTWPCDLLPECFVSFDEVGKKLSPNQITFKQWLLKCFSNSSIPCSIVMMLKWFSISLFKKVLTDRSVWTLTKSYFGKTFSTQPYMNDHHICF